MAIYIMNAGAGAGADPMRQHADDNIVTFAADMGLGKSRIRIERVDPRDDGHGRYGYEIRLDDHKTEVWMPGRPIEQVRFRRHLHVPSDFPCLYVDGLSRLWCYAVEMARDRLLGVAA
ncbi:MAG: hypothetical protein R3322_00210 [Kiloniellales bacterium]|nr:hypothetical protein [Kiloniellales bacterium]